METDEDMNGLDAAEGLNPKFMSFGENKHRDSEEPLNDSYNDDQLSSFQTSPLEMASEINYIDNTDITISRN